MIIIKIHRCLYCFVKFQRPARSVDVQFFDEPATRDGDPLTITHRLVPCVDNVPGSLQFVLPGGEYLVRVCDLIRMNQRLAVKSELFALTAGAREAG